MFADLEVRRGRIDPLYVRTEVSGGEHSVSSTTITTFELDGAIMEFSGGTLPFRAGDEVIVAGRPGRSGVFKAYAFSLPRKKIVLDDHPTHKVVSGAISLAFGLGMGSVALPLAWSALPDIGPLAVCLLLTLGFTGVGSAIIWDGMIALEARRLVMQQRS